ncbi:dentin sialophosphoprotein [Phoenix dactylifera]|uniref:Dentin sialophosphoprotein n=1 Tax=Phoenix dactylifera TaxID=42345 RepID=A0A8B8J6M6_PHODC|nr:dentin sialophosphoprotein [Phoenix dactylifera]
MFKLGRGGGGGRGGGKRSLPLPPPPPTIHRPASAAGARLPIGASSASALKRPGGTPTDAPAREETFSLESGGALDFAAIIRLTPDLVEEIRRVEAQGGTARIKFDSNLNNPTENVIDVGGKEFKFTWSRELGDLCDIYEEHRNGEDGHGLLVESGSAWRKLNVQRILDESTKNHVKMRSEEAERLSKSRKAIVLDPANPSVKNQAKSMAAAQVEGNMRRIWKKEPFFKKRKVEPNQVSNIGPPKSVFRPGTSSKNTAKSMLSESPLPSPPEQPGPGTSASPFGTGTSLRGDSNHEDTTVLPHLKKEGASNEKEMPSRMAHGAKQGSHGHIGGNGDQPTDLRSMLITLLSDYPKGMSLKALEKAVGETIPNAAKKIEGIIKNIATFQAPGRYFLKPGVEVESSKRRTSESGSSPESAHDHPSVAESVHVEKASNKKFEKQTESSLNLETEPNHFEKIDPVQNSPGLLTSERKVNNDSDGRTGSSSESGSDSESESDSSDSGSDSGSQSRSKSRSPGGSGSASSSDSESDGSSSSKEGSDVHVDIMTSDDEKEEAVQETVAAESKLSSLARSWRAYDGEHEQNNVALRNQEGQNASSSPNDFERGDEMDRAVEATKYFPINRSDNAFENSETEAARSTELNLYQRNSKFSEEGLSFSPHQQRQSEGRQIAYGKVSVSDANEQVSKQALNEKQNLRKDGSGHELSDVTERISKPKSKRVSSRDLFQEKPKSAKRPKAAIPAQVTSCGKNGDATFSESSHHLSPDRSKQERHKEANNVEWDRYIDNGSQEYGSVMRGRPVASGNLLRMQPSPDLRNASSIDAEQSGQKIGNLDGRRKALDSMEKSSRYMENFGRGNRHAEGVSIRHDDSDTFATKNIYIQDKTSMSKDKLHKDMRDENNEVTEKNLAKNAREITVGDKLSTPDSYNRRQKSDMDKSPVSARTNLLRRELSDLELGEFREPPAGEESGGVKRQFERKGSFKSLENKVAATDNSNLDTSNGRTASNALNESKRQPSPNLRGVNGNQDGFYRGVPSDGFFDSTRPQQRAVLSQNQQLSRVDHADSEAMSHFDRPAEFASRNETRTNQGVYLENHADAPKKIPASMLPQHDNNHGGQMGSRNIRDSKPQKSNALGDSKNQNKNSFVMENDSSGRKKRDSSSDEDNSLYSKYDKACPELKGPVRDLSQYEEYVQEYREKYEIYCYLNKNLEKIRDDFLKVGHDLELAKGRDMEEYYNIVEQLRDMYHHCGPRQKQMKKVFTLLHEELKNLKQRIKDFAEDYTKE